MNIKRFNGNDFPGDKWVRDILTRVNEIVDYLKLKVTRDRLASDVTSVLSPITAKGDLVVGGASGATQRLPIGTDGQVLTSDGATAGWESLPAATATQRGLVAPRTVQTNLTVTCAQGGFTSIRAVGVAYQDQGGSWRLKFNLVSTFTSATITAMTLSISGVTFKNTSNFYQAVNAFFFVAPLAPKAYADPNSNNIIISSPSTASVAGISISGDVELDSKPTWAN